jgi:nicotinate-nucleotide--dimethylbenzimidazole phosphoribosyltransferase
LFASHLSAEKGHKLILDELKLTPVLDLEMRLGEGTGACLLMGLMEAAVRIMGEMATFESAGVKEKIK